MSRRGCVLTERGCVPAGNPGPSCNILSATGQPGLAVSRLGSQQNAAHLRSLFEWVKKAPFTLELPYSPAQKSA